jgi:hypothetical protein
MIKQITFSMAMAALLPITGYAEESKKIQDNSFLIEEAYNQEAGVVQHIQSMAYDRRTKDWFYNFTQEWPFPDETHQLSYTIPLTRLKAPGNTGIGDVMLNYRYQAISSERVAFAPRLSLILPIGDYKKEMGTGAAGLQVNLPLSVELTDKWVTHFNLGTTYTPRSRESGGARANTTGTNVGASLIYLLSDNFNLMLEVVQIKTELVQPDGSKQREKQTLLSPGFRYAINYDSGLQVVSGLALPYGAGSSSGDQSVLLYLSLEHPFK